MSNQAFSLIDAALQSGLLRHVDHDRIIELVHRDGKIDEEENRRLSKLFNAIQSGEIKLVDRIQSDSASNTYKSELESLKKDAILRQDTKVNKALEATPPSIPENQTSEDNKVPLKFQATELIEEDLSHDSISSMLDIPVYKDLSRDSNDHNITFFKASDRLLQAEINGPLWARTGSMVAYRGNMNFRREGITEHGLGKLIKRGLTGESTALMKIEGRGKVFLADQGKKISIARLKGIPLYIQSEHILAFDPSIKWEIQTLFNMGTALAGGLFHLRFHGKGEIAFTSRFEPFVMRVSPDNPLTTDAHATVGWSSGLVPSIKTDINLQTLIGRSSGETIQIKFEGDGIVIVQPYEEDSRITGK